MGLQEVGPGRERREGGTPGLRGICCQPPSPTPLPSGFLLRIQEGVSVSWEPGIVTPTQVQTPPAPSFRDPENPASLGSRP